MKQALKNFFNNPARVVALIALVFLLILLTACAESQPAPSPESQTKIGPSATMYTVKHDDHMFVVYATKVFQGGLVHHPECLRCERLE